MTGEKAIRLLERERFELSKKSGGGILQYEAWGYQEKDKTVVTRYGIAYVNHTIFAGDNGRVLGYDNAHGYHHRHWMGSVEPFSSSLMPTSWRGSRRSGRIWSKGRRSKRNDNCNDSNRESG